MRLLRLTLRDVKGVVERTVRFAPVGVTIVQGENESGKTTLTDALDLLLDYRDDSNAAAVRAAKPVGSDVGAFVEAELEAGGCRLVYAKRFHRDRSTTLTVHGPMREHHTGRAAHDRATQLLAETVDLDLWRALRLQQGAKLEQPDLIEHASLSAALDAVGGAGLADDRAAGVYARVEEEYSRYYTPTGRPKRTLTDPATTHQNAIHHADRLSQELDALDTDVARSAALARHRDELTARLVSQRRLTQDLDAAVAAVERQEQTAERLRLGAKLAQQDHDQAVANVRERALLSQAVSKPMEAREALGSQLEEAAPALAEAEKLEAELEGQATSLRERLTAARADLRDHQAQLDAVRDRAELANLDARLARVAAAQQAARQARELIERCAVDDACLETVEAAELEVIGARAALQARSTTVTLTALRDIDVSADGRPKSLEKGDSAVHRVAEALRLRIGDAAELSVSAGEDAAAVAAALTDALTRRDQYLAAAGAADLTAARALHRERAALEAESAQAQRDLETALDRSTLETLTAHAARLRDRLASCHSTEASPEDVRSTLTAAQTTVNDHERELLDLGAELREVAGGRERLTTASAVAESQLRAAIQRLSEARAALASARAVASDEALEIAAAEAQGIALAAAAHYGQTLSDLQASETVEVRERRDQAVEAQQRLSSEVRDVEDELRDVTSRLDVRGEQGLHDSFEEAMRQREHALRELTAVEARAAAARLLFATMRDHRDAARRSYAAPFRDKLERLARIVFGEDLQVELDDDLRVARRTLGGVTLDYDQLSGGAREQLTVLARLACAAIVSADGGVPLILDDALGYTDPARLERLGTAFRAGAGDCQVIVLTCDPNRYAHIPDATLVHLT